jgi:hypothetical protein
VSLPGAGLVAIAFYAVHAARHVARGRAEDALWMCHLAALGVGLGLLLRAPALNAGSVLWLALGVPLWAISLVSGGEFHPTSLLPHLGGLALGAFGVARLGVPDGVWPRALGALAALIVACRIATPERADVNLAFTLLPARGPISLVNVGAVLALLPLVAACFVGLERGLVKAGLGAPRRAG